MKNKVTPYNLEELKLYLEYNGLTDTISKFKLESSMEPNNVFGIETPETYKITIVMDCIPLSEE